jgi:hypothetical protein
MAPPRFSGTSAESGQQRPCTESAAAMQRRPAEQPLGSVVAQFCVQSWVSP